TSAKRWVWLTKQNCWGYGYQRADGLWVIDPGTKRARATQAARAAQADPMVQTTQLVQPAQAVQPAGDPDRFVNWLNGVRASMGLGPVGYDANLSAWAQQNNSAQAAYGLGHHVMGPARRQNSAMGSAASIGMQWMASPAHRAALLDPTISAIGIAG